MQADEKLPKCLLVDDLEENLIALKSLLESEEVEILTARSGKEALELLLAHDFALSLIDVQMPEMDGFELAEIMRSTEKTKSIPIIFVTAAGTDAQRIFRGYEAGAVDFLHKPLNSHIVVSKVRIFLQLHNQKVQLEEKRRKLQEALRSRDEFLSICSHELKTPLTSLKMQIQMNKRLKEKKGDEVAFSLNHMKKFMDQADRGVERIIHLVNDMLDISRVTTGRLSFNFETVDLSHLTQDVTERMRPLMDMASNQVSLKTDPEVFVRADKFRLEQVLTNLLMNAAKYAPESEVEVKVKKTDKEAILSVADQGQGISLEDQQKIFQRFERAASTNSSVTGLGLGLYISQEIIQKHGGKITVCSEMGKGTTFEVKLPLLQ